ncbi:MAG: prepilin-type N-terminal cleavage/methylation domain-containing protein [Bacteroidota bacterium]|nr:prepilin-type N-terminal cleavage/methylation domain-containing protein [Bacteroidota bacterium]
MKMTKGKVNFREKTMLQKKIQENGFTLLEVLIAVAILTIGILGVNALQITAIRGNSTARGLTESTNFASAQVEELIEAPYIPPNPCPNDDGSSDYFLCDDNNDGVVNSGEIEKFLNNDPTASPPDGTAVSPDNKQTIYWYVANDTPVARTKTVMVHLVRTDRGQRRTVTLNYVIPEII